MSKSGVIMSTLRCSVHWGNIMMDVVGYHKYIGEGGGS